MSKLLDFRDIGLECDLILCARTEQELIEKAGDHIQAAHGAKGFSKDFYGKVRRAIQEAQCDPGEEFS